MGFRVSLVFLVTCWALITAPAAEATETIDLNGYLDTIWVDPYPGSGQKPSLIITFTPAGGKAIQMPATPESLARLGDYFSWNGKEVQITVSGQDLTDDPQLMLSDRNVIAVRPLRAKSDIQSKGQQPRLHGDSAQPIEPIRQEWITIFCKFNDIPNEPLQPPQFQDRYDDSLAGIENYWHEVSYGNLEVIGSVASAWVTLPGGYSDYLLSPQNPDVHALFQDCTGEAGMLVDFSDGDTGGYFGINMVFNSDSIGNAAGRGGTRFATLGGIEKSWGVTWLATSDFALSPHVVTHEMGHAMGLPHSDNGDQDDDPYDSPWDVMSAGFSFFDEVFGWVGTHTNAYHKYELGWIGGEQLLVVQESGEYSLSLIASGVGEADGLRSVLIPIYGSNEFYTVEARKRFGSLEGYLPGDAIIIHKVDPTRRIGGFPAPSWTIDMDDPPADFGNNEGTMFKVGESLEDRETGVELFVNSETVDGFDIRLDATNAMFPKLCSSRSINLTSQSKIDSFQDDFGPCDTVAGNLTIGDSGYIDVQDLMGLEDIHYINGKLTVAGARQLADLRGLKNLKGAFGGVTIISNRDLTSVLGLSGLEHVGGLSIGGNPGITNLDSLQNIKGISGGVYVAWNASLSDCSGLARLLDYADDYEPGPGPGSNARIPDVAGSINVQDNKAGCNSIEEIAPVPKLASVLTGSWYDPALAGSGFMFHAINEELAVGYYYGYDHQGDRFWLIGVHQGSIGWTDTLKFQAVQALGGGFDNFDPENIVERDWGEMWFTPGTCDTATIHLEGTFAGEDEVSVLDRHVVRLGEVSGTDCPSIIAASGTDSVTGSWYDDQLSGQGFAFHKIDENTGVVYFYGFENDSAPLWLIGVWDQQLKFGQDLAIEMFRVSGGTFQPFDPSNIVEESWGTLNLHLHNCLNGNANLVGIDGSQHFDLELLEGSFGLACE